MLLLNNNMAVELMVGFGDATTSNNFTPKMEENAAVSAVQEAASAGIQSVQNFLRLMSHTTNQQHSQDDSSTSTTPNNGYEAVADSVVNKFKKVISLLDRNRTGHARFRRAPVLSTTTTTTPPPPPPPKVKLQHQDPSSSSPISVPPIQVKKQESVSAFKVYCPTPSSVVRLPPLPHNNPHQPSHPPNTFQAQQNTSSVVLKNGSVDRKDATTTINFAPSPPISAANSYISSLTGDTESLQPSLSSGFQFTHMSQVSSAGKPPLSSSSLKRKCNSMEDSAMKCGSSSGRCHCSKKRKNRIKRVIRVPAVSSKLADIPPDDYSWRKYGQKPIKGSPHPRVWEWEDGKAWDGGIWWVLSHAT
ncbi:putative WRKY transcription factor 7 isoform X2 [Cucumis melo var. makuwa]|uniref:Putative WRKY transcription factor 7 isoform X2 n=1 Tax=Cucumis melo var. makuwa TaxID=1194695 RepID=A0A5D3D9E6_CUCMM|nr:putative WRKY transcription factor 7 isoform X2 [Cucumis melo var. makuwa]